VSDASIAAQASSGRDTDGAALTDLRRQALLFLVTAVVFFPLIFNPLAFGFFGQESETELLVFVEDNFAALRLLFTGIGLTELALGVALWLWSRQVAAHTPGGRATVAQVAGWVGLASGVLSLASRLSGWFEDAEEVAGGDLSPLEWLFAPAFGGFSVSIIAFGVLMVMGAMPTWLGLAWIASGVLAWVGILPFWFFAAALALGIWGLVRLRPGQASAQQVSAVRAASAT
jgi:hypothetical protein